MSDIQSSTLPARSEEPNPWRVIGLLTSVFLLVAGWISNVITIVPGEDPLMSQFQAAALLLAPALLWSLWTVRSPAVGAGLRKAAMVLLVLSLAGLGLAFLQM